MHARSRAAATSISIWAGVACRSFRPRPASRSTSTSQPRREEAWRAGSSGCFAIPRRAVAPFLLGGTLTTGLVLLVVANTTLVPVLLTVAGVAGIAQSMVLVTYLTARTAHSPDVLLGRIGSTARTISLGLQPLGLLAGGALIDLTDGSTTLAIMGVVLLVLSAAFVPVTALRRGTLMPIGRP